MYYFGYELYLAQIIKSVYEIIMSKDLSAIGLYIFFFIYYFQDSLAIQSNTAVQT